MGTSWASNASLWKQVGVRLRSNASLWEQVGVEKGCCRISMDQVDKKVEKKEKVDELKPLKLSKVLSGPTGCELLDRGKDFGLWWLVKKEK